jgi:hypothetical protein
MHWRHSAERSSQPNLERDDHLRKLPNGKCCHAGVKKTLASGSLGFEKEPPPGARSWAMSMSRFVRVQSFPDAREAFPQVWCVRRTCRRWRSATRALLAPDLTTNGRPSEWLLRCPSLRRLVACPHHAVENAVESSSSPPICLQGSCRARPHRVRPGRLSIPLDMRIAPATVEDSSDLCCWRNSALLQRGAFCFSDRPWLRNSRRSSVTQPSSTQ